MKNHEKIKSDCEDVYNAGEGFTSW